MDVVQKKQEVLGDIARQPANVVFARIAICDEVQLADLMKEEFISYFRNPAAEGSTDSLHQVCIKLAKQRALLQGATINDVIHFGIQDTSGTSAHSSTGDLSFAKLQDASYSSLTTFGYTVMHDLNADGGTVILSSTSNANTIITIRFGPIS